MRSRRCSERKRHSIALWNVRNLFDTAYASKKKGEHVDPKRSSDAFGREATVVASLFQTLVDQPTPTSLPAELDATGSGKLIIRNPDHKSDKTGNQRDEGKTPPPKSERPGKRIDAY